jgi:hypothetical protein
VPPGPLRGWPRSRITSPLRRDTGAPRNDTASPQWKTSTPSTTVVRTEDKGVVLVRGGSGLPEEGGRTGSSATV